jgi:hypothetical protein
MPLPLIGYALTALVTKSTNKNKDDFQAVKGRKKSDGSPGKPYVRKKRKK